MNISTCCDVDNSEKCKFDTENDYKHQVNSDKYLGYNLKMSIITVAKHKDRP